MIEELYDEFRDDVYHFSLYFTNNKQEAEDITQETFIKVMKNIHQLKDVSKKKTWLLSIAKNTAIDLKRKQKLINFLPQLLKGNGHKSHCIATDENRLINTENWRELQNAILTLKLHYRSVVILRALKELSVKETAEILGCTEGKVRVDFHRAINQLKKELIINEGGDFHEESKSK
ncbi:RNA polymerase sigma factor [Paenisporosarcina sp. OV554]|uniref:RNA polymerase sigma factor n=1 Tax=Paenisporosarcina sp. OV554 TaxID=2135694 RepID=UPI001E5C3D25|nr:RNA polymerase sigma factor [Paenisporosarcina sp. OV554]